MSPETITFSEDDKTPLIKTEDTDIESPSLSNASSVESIGLKGQPLQVNTSSTSNPFASFDETFNHNENNKPDDSKKHYQSVGELFWLQGQMYSDVRLTFEDRGILATRAGLPSELRLHSLVLFQSQFFREQLSASTAVPCSPTSNIMKEKQIIVRLPSRVTEEDMINFQCTLKLMYTKNWDIELANNLTKGVGCLSVCCEIGFHEGIETCWKWLIKKCIRDGNKEMLKRLIEAYPNLHEQFTESEDINVCMNSNNEIKSIKSNKLNNTNNTNSNNNTNISKNSYLDVPLQKPSSKGKRTSCHSSRRSNRSRRRTNSNESGSYNRPSVSPMLKSYRSDTSISTDSSASPRIRYEKELPRPPSMSLSPPLYLSSPSSPTSPSLPSPPLSNPSHSPITSDNSPTTPKSSHFPSLPSTVPPSIFNNEHILNTWITNFESYAISSKRACSQIPIASRKDRKCFPFLEHFITVFDSIDKLGRAKRINSPQALDFTLRMLNVIKIEHAHFHSLHALSQNYNYQPRSPASPRSRPTSPRPLPLNCHNTPPIVLHESLDKPLSHILKNVLSPMEQKHLCDYLWAPSNISNLMHLREIRSDDDDDMEEDEFVGYDQLMSEVSLVKASRVSKVEHMVVGEHVAKCIREIRLNTD